MFPNFRFRMAYIAPSSRIYGRGELVIDPSKIDSRYLHKDFWFDVLSALPIPQLLNLWAVIPSMRGSNTISAKHGIRIAVIFQYILRLYLIFPLSSKIITTAGVVVEAAWAGAAFNLMLFMLASHVIGSCWYLLSIERLEGCWKNMLTGDRGLLRAILPNSPASKFFSFGDALTYEVANSSFLQKYSYCFLVGTANYEVSLFDEMDECTLDAICERLKPILCTSGTCIFREGDPIVEMLFILTPTPLMEVELGFSIHLDSDQGTFAAKSSSIGPLYPTAKCSPPVFHMNCHSHN